jgi:hypothetical protein
LLSNKIAFCYLYFTQINSELEVVDKQKQIWIE